MRESRERLECGGSDHGHRTMRKTEESQGAIAMVGPNYKVGVKFTCHPGEQFLIRRKAFAAIQTAIKEHGIKVSIPRVVVDSPGDVAAAAAAAISTPPRATG